MKRLKRSLFLFIFSTVGLSMYSQIEFNFELKGYLVCGYYQSEDSWSFIPDFLGLQDSLVKGLFPLILLDYLYPLGLNDSLELSSYPTRSKVNGINLVPSTMYLSQQEIEQLLFQKQPLKRPRFELPGKYYLFYTGIQGGKGSFPLKPFWEFGDTGIEVRFERY